MHHARVAEHVVSVFCFRISKRVHQCSHLVWKSSVYLEVYASAFFQHAFSGNGYGTVEHQRVVVRYEQGRVGLMFQYILLHILLSITQEDLAGIIGYVRLLGFRKESSPLLRRLQDNSRIPVITKAADYRKLISENQWLAFEKDLFCADLYESVKAEKSQKPFVSDLQRSPVIL